MERLSIIDIARYELLSAEEELALGTTIQAWRKAQQSGKNDEAIEEKARKAIDQLVLSHWPLVRRITSGAFHDKMRREDAIQELLLLMVKMTKNFDPQRARFAKYVKSALERKRDELLSYDLKGGSVSANTNRQLRTLRILLDEDKGEEISDSLKYLADRISLITGDNITPSEVRDLLLLHRATRSPVSLDGDKEGDDGSLTPMGDFIADPSAEEGFGTVTRNCDARTFKEMISAYLETDEANIIILAFGLENREEMTDEAIALELDIKLAEVRKKRASALRKLKHHLSEAGISEADI
jgi:RNA polymerase sigma factor (sigma-70 family)